MAVLYAADYKLTLNSVNMSDHVQAVGVNPVGQELDVSAMGNAGWNQFISGMAKYQLTVMFFNDYAAAQVDALLWPLFRTQVAWILAPTSAVVGTGNPFYSGTVTISQLEPMKAQIGQLVMSSVTWSGTGALARAVA